MERRNSSRLAEDARVLRGQTIDAPAHYQGVGNALRSAFSPGALPDELQQLLRRIG